MESDLIKVIRNCQISPFSMKSVGSLIHFLLIYNSNPIFVVGRGAYSNVFKVRRFSDGKIYALKKIDFGRFTKKEKDNALLEISVLAGITSTNNLINFYEAFLDEDGNSLW